jgi:shikimate kinase
MTASDGLRPTSRIALTGFMAAGKSTVGRALAARLKWQSVDLDCEIERASARSVREIFAENGEHGFRKLERDALLTILQAAGACIVIALGGGTFVQPQNAELLRGAGVRVVFLELPLEELLRRCRALAEHSRENPRPLADNEKAFRALYAQRLPHYCQADLTVHTEGKSPQQVAREIARAFGLMTRAAKEE